jgi:hypothetical protein
VYGGRINGKVSTAIAAGQHEGGASPLGALCYPAGMYDQHLAQAERHVAQFQIRVTRQKQIVDELAQAGHDTDCAVSMLRALEKCLQAFEEHRAMISGRPTVG